MEWKEDSGSEVEEGKEKGEWAGTQSEEAKEDGEVQGSASDDSVIKEAKEEGEVRAPGHHLARTCKVPSCKGYTRPN